MQRSIDRNDWARFFESFTRQHDHWLVSVDGEAGLLPLQGITTRDDGRVSVHLGADIRHHRRIEIDARNVRVIRKHGVEEGVEIEASDGHVTRLRFRSAMPPELVDGITP